MQKSKTDIRNIILRAAREEFADKGFKNTSMRKIAGKAGIGVSNIYNYYRSKDEIYCTVLSPLIRTFETLCKQHNSSDYLTTDVFTMKSYQRKMLDDFMVIIREHKMELKLLLFRSDGSSLENFRRDFTDRQTHEGIKYMKRMKAEYPYVNCNISSFLFIQLFPGG